MSAWTNCTDRLPEMVNDGFGDLESGWLLARLGTGEVYVAQLCQFGEWADDETREPRWVQRGQDAYDLENVVAWAEIPA